ncbi:MAG: ABC transporter ATP-binding protein [Candidatus Heimdallarchaeota archaeon]|nr:ABC transporter ATP-binding protein [Candidatus Heimdallarchaeota archaeon]
MVELVLEDIHIMYDDFHAIKGFNLTVKDSEIATLLGPSGCGKTSLLRAVAGFNIPSSGRIFLDDEDITELPPQKRGMGMIFQNYALWPHMSVEANIGYGLKVRKVGREERKKIVMDLVKQVQLEGHDQKFPTQLSGGQQQRVALARALAISPKILLCDEPLSNLDFKLRVELRTEIRDIAKQHGVTVVYVTHDQTEALAISDKVAIIDEGTLIQEGSPLSIFSNPETLFVANFVGENNTLDATVSDTSGKLKVKLKSGEELITNVTNSDLAPGIDVTLVTRFNELNFAPAEAGNQLKGKLRHLAFMGDFVQAEITLHDDKLFTVNIKENLEKYSNLEMGSEVSIQIPADAMFVFKDGKRVV